MTRAEYQKQVMNAERQKQAAWGGRMWFAFASHQIPLAVVTPLAGKPVA